MKNSKVKKCKSEDRPSLKVYKETFQKCLTGLGWNKNHINFVKTAPNIIKLKTYVFKKLKEHRPHLDKARISYEFPRRGVNITKTTPLPEHNDETTSSIIPIYTPMGNKR
jgi:hypothetical protein